MRRIEVTAHRGYSSIAPENTLSAVARAIEAGADWAEIDAQETKDGVVVLLHDASLARTGLDPRRLADLTFEELRGLDVGRAFAPAFAGERVPTLEEVLNLAHGRLKLNVELKYHGEDPRLARDVAHIIGGAHVEGRCIVTSMDLGALSVVRRESPSLKTGAILTSLGDDVGTLAVDVLSVVPDLVTVPLILRARQCGMSVHVWTVDDEREAERLMALGVDNLITNDPAKMIRLRESLESNPPAP